MLQINVVISPVLVASGEPLTDTDLADAKDLAGAIMAARDAYTSRHMPLAKLVDQFITLGLQFEPNTSMRIWAERFNAEIVAAGGVAVGAQPKAVPHE